VRDLLEARFAQSGIGSSNVGVIANLRLDIVVTPNKDARYHILGQVGFHLARIEMLDQHQHDQGHI
jgi:hypothetical protein